MRIKRALGNLRRQLRVLARLARQGRNPAQFPKYLPAFPEADDYTLCYRPPVEGAPLPVPPKELWLGYAENEADYLEGGRRHLAHMLELAPLPSPPAGRSLRVLDLGCGGGRMIRHLLPQAPAAEIWGLDISAEHINWLKMHLSPPFHFATTTTIPHLPFADGYFDYVYCGSLFTHIEDLAESWILEVARVIRSSGTFYCTVHDEHTAKILVRDRHPFAAGIVGDSSNLGDVRVIGRDTHSNVLYSTRYLKNAFSPLFEITNIALEAYGYQTAWILRKR